MQKPNDIIERLYFYMNEKNLTLNRIATLTGITQSTLNSMTSKNSYPKVNTLLKICNVLKIPVTEFLDFPPYNQYPNDYFPEE